MRSLYIRFQKHISVTLFKDRVILAEDTGPHLLARNPASGQVLGQALGNRAIILNVFPPHIKFILIGGADPFLDQGPEILKFCDNKVGSDCTQHVPPAIEYAQGGIGLTYGINLSLISICHKDRWQHAGVLGLD
jgi:hypothetical protein